MKLSSKLKFKDTKGILSGEQTLLTSCIWFKTQRQ